MNIVDSIQVNTTKVWKTIELKSLRTFLLQKAQVVNVTSIHAAWANRFISISLFAMMECDTQVKLMLSHGLYIAHYNEMCRIPLELPLSRFRQFAFLFLSFLENIESTKLAYVAFWTRLCE